MAIAQPSLFFKYARALPATPTCHYLTQIDEGAASYNRDELAGSGDGRGLVAARELALMDEVDALFAEGRVQLWNLRMVAGADLREGAHDAVQPVDVPCEGVRLQIDEGGVGRPAHVLVEMLLRVGDGVAGSDPHLLKDAAQGRPVAEAGVEAQRLPDVGRRDRLRVGHTAVAGLEDVPSCFYKDLGTCVFKLLFVMLEAWVAYVSDNVKQFQNMSDHFHTMFQPISQLHSTHMS